VIDKQQPTNINKNVGQHGSYLEEMAMKA